MLPSISSACGSSPRVRGTRRSTLALAPCRRFIPACAGNAPARASGARPTAVHPRVCGERARVRRHGMPPCGSSPRVRGTHHVHAGRHHRIRFIPACAGNASFLASSASIRSVHPRVCGERDLGLDGYVELTGSSPRVRGTRGSGGEPTGRHRFIPACAGNALLRNRRSAHRPVHPRVCGERLRKVHAGSSFAGSSPRVRGTRGEAPCAWGEGRFIPACAGNAVSQALRTAA